MPSSRIFVSYACVGDERGATVGRQLVRDIRATGTEAVADHETISDERFMPFLNRELPQCGYLIFVQTPATLRSLRVQAAVTLALTLLERQQMRGVLRMIAAPLSAMDSQPLLASIRTFDASIDYARARDQLFLELGLIRLDINDSLLVPSSLLFPESPAHAENDRPPRSSGPVPIPSASPAPAPVPAPFGSIPAPSRPPSPPVNMPGGGTPVVQPYAPPVAPPGLNMQRGNIPAVQPYAPPVASPGLNAQRGSMPGMPPYAPPAVSPGQGALASPARGKASSKIQKLFARPLKTTQTSIMARPDKRALSAASTLVEDRPLPLKTTRKTIIRVAIIVGLLLLLALVALLILFLLHGHTTIFNHPSPTPPAKPHLSPTPRRHR